MRCGATDAAGVVQAHKNWLRAPGNPTEGRPSNSSSRRDSALGRHRLQLRKAILRTHTPSHTPYPHTCSAYTCLLSESPLSFQGPCCSRLFEAFRFTFGLSSTLHVSVSALRLLPWGLEVPCKRPDPKTLSLLTENTEIQPFPNNYWTVRRSCKHVWSRCGVLTPREEPAHSSKRQAGNHGPEEPSRGKTGRP